MDDKFRHFLAGTIAGATIFTAAFLLSDCTSEPKPTGEIGTALSITRELHCQEDEDVIVTLGSNGLPYAFCMQAIPR